MLENNGSANNAQFSLQRQPTPDEIAEKWGRKTQIFTTSFLTIFTRLGGFLFLIGSLFLSYLEAQNAADLINTPNQFWKSFGVSAISIAFSVIGFLGMARALTFKKLMTEFPLMQEAALTAAGDKGVKLYEIAIALIGKEYSKNKLIAILCIAGNIVCSVLTVIAVITALKHNPGIEATVAVWIYTFTISILAFFAGACITMISPEEVTVKDVLLKAARVYGDYAWMDGLANNIDMLDDPNFS